MHQFNYARPNVFWCLGQGCGAMQRRHSSRIILLACDAGSKAKWPTGVVTCSVHN